MIQKQIPSKNVKQIRDRFLNVIQFNNKQFKSFTVSDDSKVLKLFELYPNDWKKISEHFKNKSSAVIKERYYYLREHEGDFDENREDVSVKTSQTKFIRVST